MGHDRSRAFGPEAWSVTEARRFAEETATAWGVCTPELSLVVSELATNAVRHSGGGFEVRLRMSRGGLRVEVADHSPDEPVLLHPPAEATSGRGIQIVAAVAGAWGVSNVHEDGKVTWAQLPVAMERDGLSAVRARNAPERPTGRLGPIGPPATGG